MATEFKQKACLKCGQNHDGETTVCYFCHEKAKREEAKRVPAPEHYWLENLIQRDGDSEYQVGRMIYTFKHNEHGHSVCEVPNLGDYRFLVKGGNCRPYEIPTDAPDPVDPIKQMLYEHEERTRAENSIIGNNAEEQGEDAQGDIIIATILSLSEQGKTDTEISQILDNGLSRQAVTRMRIVAQQ